jgi:hypothetical protein
VPKVFQAQTLQGKLESRSYCDYELSIMVQQLGEGEGRKSKVCWKEARASNTQEDRNMLRT